MISLTISPQDPRQEFLQEKLESLSLARRVSFDTGAQLPILVHNGKTYQGLASVQAYLNELENLVADWYECTCDKYDF